VAAEPNLLQRRAQLLQQRAARLSPNTRAMAWSIASSFLFVVLNSLMRELTLQMHAYEVQFLRYFMGLVVMLPLMLRAGLATYRPKNILGQFTRGAVHTVGLILWFVAVTHITIADTTAISFTTPIFIMLGAVLLFKEPMRWERWLASAIGFAGVLIVVGPKLTGQGGWYSLVMLSASPVFAASFLITKALTRYERVEVIVAWQAISITVLSLPLALLHWTWPSLLQWLLLLACGLLGSSAHYCLTRSYARADMSATQSVRFLELVWATLLGWMVFGDSVSSSTLMGGVVICASTLWIARRETRGPR